jgi:hypothetical protein
MESEGLVRRLRWIVLGVAAVTLFGASAAAAPATYRFATGNEPSAAPPCTSPSPAPSVAPSPTPSDEPCPSPTDSPSPSPSSPPSSHPSQPPSALTCPTPPPATSTGKPHGLENAISHVFANCTAHPTPGLVNALNHLIENLAGHQEHQHGKQGAPHGSGHSDDGVHGKSASAPGHIKHGK